MGWDAAEDEFCLSCYDASFARGVAWTTGEAAPVLAHSYCCNTGALPLAGSRGSFMFRLMREITERGESNATL